MDWVIMLGILLIKSDSKVRRGGTESTMDLEDENCPEGEKLCLEKL